MPIIQGLGRLAPAVFALIAAAGLASGQEADNIRADPVVLIAAVEGPIGPATTRHVTKAVEAAADRRAEALILRLNTPGGLADAMRDIASAILTSPTPVIGYVFPPGAHAASAGTYILYATHVAAMAPGTNLGAATPIALTPMPGPTPGGDEQPFDPEPTESAESDGDESEQDETLEDELKTLAPSDAMTAKATNDAVAFIRSLAEMHGRNADWAERAVREAASLSSAQALEQGVIDLVADDVGDLLEAIDRRTVKLGDDERVLRTKGLAIETIEMDAMTRLLSVLSNPNVALLLMMIGLYGIIFEFWNPGAIAPGVIGAICLTLGLYALNQLPLDYAGLALIALGVAFMVMEAFTPTFGIMGFGGLIAFVLGSAMLIDTDTPEYQISWWLIGTMAVMSAAVLIVLLGYTLSAYRRAPVSGASRMLGTEAQVLVWTEGSGFVWAESERWSATGPADLAAGAPVRIRGVDGLTLVVAPDDAETTDAEKP